MRSRRSRLPAAREAWIRHRPSAPRRHRYGAAAVRTLSVRFAVAQLSVAGVLAAVTASAPAPPPPTASALRHRSPRSLAGLAGTRLPAARCAGSLPLRSPPRPSPRRGIAARSLGTRRLRRARCIAARSVGTRPSARRALAAMFATAVVAMVAILAARPAVAAGFARDSFACASFPGCLAPRTRGRDRDHGHVSGPAHDNDPQRASRCAGRSRCAGAALADASLATGASRVRRKESATCARICRPAVRRPPGRSSEPAQGSAAGGGRGVASTGTMLGTSGASVCGFLSRLPMLESSSVGCSAIS